VSPGDRSLVARTLGLYERIDLFRSTPSSFTVTAKAHERCAQWAKAFSSLGSCDSHDTSSRRSLSIEGAFERRLRFDGFDRTTILPVLGDLVLPDDFASPPFLEVVGAVREELRAFPASDFHGPWLAVAKRRVLPWARISDTVQKGFERSLLRDLGRCSAPTLAHELDLDRIAALRSANTLLSRIDEGQAVPRALDGASALGLLEKYPGLARLCATRVLDWARHVSEVLTRLEGDRADLEVAFGALGDLEAVDADVSDPHNGGRSVVILRFSSGTKLVYKPRDLGAESAFQGLVRRVNELGFAPPLRALSVIERTNYGWVEWVPTLACQETPRAYYRRCGALLALMTLVRGYDCHYENIIPNGSDPVLIDLEGLCAPRTGGDPEALSSLDAIAERMESSVLRTGMLPSFTAGLDGKVKDLSAMGARLRRRANVDAPELEMTPDAFETSGGHPVLDFEDEVQAGLRHAHQLLLALAEREGRDALVALVATFDAITTRHVVRATVGYLRLLEESRRPDLMRDGLERSIALDRIARTFLGVRERPSAWAVVRVEHEDLESGDVPCFLLQADGRSIYRRDPDSGALVALGDDAFSESGASAVRRTLRTLSGEDTKIESKLVSQSFAARAAAAEQAPAKRPPSEALSSFDERRVVDHALGIARRIARGGLVVQGHRHHVGVQLDRATGTPGVAILGPDLYAGLPGIALFLGAAASVAEDDELRVAALGALVLTREAFRTDAKDAVRILGGGAFEGVGGLLYVFARLSRLLNEPSLIDEACSVAGAITKKEIDESDRHDLVSGTAGLLLSLAAVDAALGSNAHGAMIEHCGHALLRHAKRESAGIGWPTAEGRPSCCGMAHGNAGIAMALAEAWRLGGPREFRDAAESAHRYERSLRDDVRGEWQHLRALDPDRPSPPAFMSTWCNGAPGIALARARVLSIFDDAGARADLELATRTTCTASRALDHLCCGEGGLDEILFTLGTSSHDAALIDLARRRAMARLVRSEDRRPPFAENEGFMLGAAGVGFSLLRMTTKGQALASVLDLSV
jgi:type 2 lantibiotic biosynthesis protein LanM